jgi:hypothetical protein
MQSNDATLPTLPVVLLRSGSWNIINWESLLTWMSGERVTPVDAGEGWVVPHGERDGNYLPRNRRVPKRELRSEDEKRRKSHEAGKGKKLKGGGWEVVEWVLAIPLSMPCAPSLIAALNDRMVFSGSAAEAWEECGE